MKVICSKSNIEFTASGFPSFKLSSQHPLFSASFSTLLEVAKKHRELSEGESRVLFLSLLDSTQLIDWKCAATPPHGEVVVKYMEYLLTTVNWINAIGTRITLPRIAINHSTRLLLDVKNWLSVWNNVQKEATISSHLLSVREAVAASQRKLLSMMTTGTTPHGKDAESSTLYAKHLASWFMISARVPPALHTYWTSLFSLQRPEVWNARLVDLVELKDHCEEFLDVPSSTYAMACYRHICKLHDDCRDGVLGALTTSSFSATTSAPYTIVQEDTELRNIQIAAAQAPEDMPLESSYPTKGSYLVARARWNIKVRLLAASASSLPTSSGDSNSAYASTTQPSLSHVTPALPSQATDLGV